MRTYFHFLDVNFINEASNEAVLWVCPFPSPPPLISPLFCPSSLLFFTCHSSEHQPCVSNQIFGPWYHAQVSVWEKVKIRAVCWSTACCDCEESLASHSLKSFWQYVQGRCEGELYPSTLKKKKKTSGKVFPFVLCLGKCYIVYCLTETRRKFISVKTGQ